MIEAIASSLVAYLLPSPISSVKPQNANNTSLASSFVLYAIPFSGSEMIKLLNTALPGIPVGSQAKQNATRSTAKDKALRKSNSVKIQLSLEFLKSYFSSTN